MCQVSNTNQKILSGPFLLKLKLTTQMFWGIILSTYILNFVPVLIYTTNAFVPSSCLDKVNNALKMYLVCIKWQTQRWWRTEGEHNADLPPSFFRHSLWNMVIDKNIDLIVMGTKGESTNHAYAFGSNTLQVLKYVACPVLVIPEFCTYDQPKHILFPTNFLIPYNRRELKLLSTLLKPFRSVVDVLYIAKYSNLSRRQIDNREFLIIFL